MTICFFGNYLKDYARNRVLIKGLKQNDVQVLECQTRERGFKKFWSLYRQHQKLKNKYDLMIVAMGGQTLVWLAKLLSRQKVVFDAFTSLYLTDVEDRKICSPLSLKALGDYFWDWFPCVLADKILLDTRAQIEYFVNKYRIKREKFIRVFVGADGDTYYPNSKFHPVSRAGHNSKFIIHWHGYMVPFHGLETVIKAAEILKNQPEIEFKIITRFNNQYEMIKKKAEEVNLKNLKFFPETSYENVAKVINEADVCLGIFGSNQKAQVVIPNKIYSAIACAKPVITARHEVLKEIFTDQKDIIMVVPVNPRDLAEKIMLLKNNSTLKEKIAQNGYQLYQERLRPKVIGERLVQDLRFCHSERPSGLLGVESLP